MMLLSLFNTNLTELPAEGWNASGLRSRGIGDEAEWKPLDAGSRYFVTILTGVVGLFVSLWSWKPQFLSWRFRGDWARNRLRIHHRLAAKLEAFLWPGTQFANQTTPQNEPSPQIPALEPLRSFCYVPTHEDTLPSFPQDRNHDTIFLVQWRMGVSLPPAQDEVAHKMMMVPCIKTSHVAPGGLGIFREPKAIKDAVYRLHAIRIQSKEPPFLVLQLADMDEPQTVDKVIQQLLRLGRRVLIMAHHDLPYVSRIPLQNVVGIVLENACILSSGERRDYFRSSALRSTAARCAEERERRQGGDFLFGLLDLWDEQPCLSVARRAGKLAKHFGAVYEQGPRMLRQTGEGCRFPSVFASLSALDILRQPQMTELHRRWCVEQADNSIPSRHITLSSEESSRRLALEDLEGIIPRIRPFLDLANGKKLSSKTTNDFHYPELWSPASSSDLLETLDETGPVSSFGCFPLNAAPPSPMHYEAIVQTQVHLKKLNLLEPMQECRLGELREQLLRFEEVESEFRHQGLIHALRDGLRNESLVAIYRSLGTGMGTHGGEAQFWGVSCSSSSSSSSRDGQRSSCVDIFLSLQVPEACVASTVLHTWLAHHGVPRFERYLVELEAGRVVGNGWGALPRSITTSLDDATPAELLLLWRRCNQMSPGSRQNSREHLLHAAIGARCKYLLLDRTADTAWRREHSLASLDGSASMHSIFQQRLDYFNKQGVTFLLPDVDDVTALFRDVETAILSALTNGDRKTLAALIATLDAAFQQPQPQPQPEPEPATAVDIVTELLCLMVFSVLRREAFEELYLEVTDRCPYFLSQPDQAASFAEVWMLGSQCEDLFGIMPRDLGLLIFNRYQHHLSRHPPPSELIMVDEDAAKDGGVELMTIYTDPTTCASEVEARESRVPQGAYYSLHATPSLSHKLLSLRKKHVFDFGVISILHLPAIIDAALLTLFDRGLFTTASMPSEHREAINYAVFVSLLISAGVAGSAAKTAQFYKLHYVYDNMILSHIQAFSGGFSLALLGATLGFLLLLASARGIGAGLVFAGCTVALSGLLSLASIIATMHQTGSPLTSGRTILWRSAHIFLISPVLSTNLSGHYAIIVYLSVLYAGFFLLCIQYRRLCQEWTEWLSQVPRFSKADVSDWYLSWSSDTARSNDARKTHGQGLEQLPTVQPAKEVERAFQEEVRDWVNRHKHNVGRGSKKTEQMSLVERVGKAMPIPPGWRARRFGELWFQELEQALQKPYQMRRCLREHNAMVLFRLVRHDILLNIAFFLVSQMHRWSGLIMPGHAAAAAGKTDASTSLGSFLGVLYFGLSLVTLDATLQELWPGQHEYSERKLACLEQARQASSDWAKRRRRTYAKSLAHMLCRMMCVLACLAVMLHLVGRDGRELVQFACHVSGYTFANVFLFNSGFTKDIRSRTVAVYSSIALGLAVRCILSFNIAGLAAAASTSILIWRQDLSVPLDRNGAAETRFLQATDGSSNLYTIFAQPKLAALYNDVELVDSGSPGHVIARWERLEHSAVVIQNSSLTHVGIGKKIAVSSRNAASIHGDGDSQAFSYSVAQTAQAMWTRHAISVSFVDHGHFVRCGFANSFSIGRFDDGGKTIKVLVSDMDRVDLVQDPGTQLSVKIAVDAIFYHISLTKDNDHHRAVQTEFLLAKSLGVGAAISARVDFELSMVSAETVHLVGQKAKHRLMRHSAYGVDVDTQWMSIPGYVRHAICRRFLCQDVPTQPELCAWVDKHAPSHVSDSIKLCSDIIQQCQEILRRKSKPCQIQDALSNSRRTYIALGIGEDSLSRRTWLLRGALYVLFEAFKWLVVVSSGASDIEREIWFRFPHNSALLSCVAVTWKWMRAMRNCWVKAMLGYDTAVLGSQQPSSFHNFLRLPWRSQAIQSRRRPTRQIRTKLWNHWLGIDTQQRNTPMSAIAACHMDELILRQEPLLGEYWSHRDTGAIPQARAALAQLTGHMGDVASVVGLDEDLSETCPLALTLDSLYAMGLSNGTGHRHPKNSSPGNGPGNGESSFPESIPVIVTDMGCWPEAPGGVSNCRRDLVGGHTTIRNHVVAECANEYGLLRYPIKESVQSLKRLPLWGLDNMTADHGITHNLLQSQVDDKRADTDVARDIQGSFTPLLRTFIRCARRKSLSRADLIRCGHIVASMSEYFECKDYAKTWDSDETERVWTEAWTERLDPSLFDNYCTTAGEPSLESPSLSDLNEALVVYRAFLFILSIGLPKDDDDDDGCPRVFQTSHNGFGSLLGLVLKHRRGANMAVWDHAILWRESLLHLSPAHSRLPLFVQSAILAGMRLVGRLAYFHADVVMPCSATFNPMWETEIGTDCGRLTSRQQFRRKIQPVLNGISDMSAFRPPAPAPACEQRITRPTVVMLSNVQLIKGIRPAIEAAGIIVNEWGFRDYQLLIYGATDRQTGYANEMLRLITQRGLGRNVHLKGLCSNTPEVLRDAWVFMNSSLSEALALAVGEAGLSGVPIVATDVGGTVLALTEPGTKRRHGELVPPNDPMALARAQISLLAMVGPWAELTADGGDGLEWEAMDSISTADTERLSRRMVDCAAGRQRLGLLSRDVILKRYNGHRYLKQHEQMYWAQWHRAKMQSDPSMWSSA